MKALIARGAAVNRPGWTPLALRGQQPVGCAAVLLLLEQGAAVECPFAQRQHPTDDGVPVRQLKTAFLRLLKKGADRSLRNERNQTAADTARLDGRDSLAESIGRPARSDRGRS